MKVFDILKCYYYFELGNGLAREESSEEKAILIVDTNSPNSDLNSSYAVSNTVSNNTSITTPSINGTYNRSILNKNNEDFLVLVTSPSLNTNRMHKKKIVASTESLTSINTSNSSSSEKNSKSSANENNIKDQKPQITSNFRTFKTNNLKNSPIQFSTPNHKFYNSNNCQELLTQRDATDLYKTMPTKVYRNHPNRQFSQAVNKMNFTSNCDQKQLNLPVNELYKRYRINVGSSSSLSSIQSSLNSVQFNLNQNAIQQSKPALDNDQNKLYCSQNNKRLHSFRKSQFIVKNENSYIKFFKVKIFY